MKAMATVMSNQLKDALVTMIHPFPVQVDLKSVMIVLDLAGLTLMLVTLALMLKELEMTVLYLAGLTLMHLGVMVAEMLVIF